MHLFGFTAYGGPEVMAHLDAPDPTPGPREVAVSMRAAGVNPADIKVRNGQRQGTVEVRFPMPMGREAAGVVLAVGDDVTGVAEGDEVFGSTAGGYGALATHVVLDATAVARRPPDLDWAAAASIPVAAGTALDALEQMAVPAGGALVVLGAGGGVGSAAVQIGRHLGLDVVGVASAAKQDLVERLGARYVASGPGWVSRVRAQLSEGADAILDLVGGDVLEEASGLLRADGRVVSAAAPDVAEALGGSGVTRRRTSAVFERVAELATTAALDILVTSRYPLAEAEKAVAEVEAGHATGNVVVIGECGART